MTLVNTMFNKCIVNKIREIIPTYRYNSLKEFYSKCSLIHTKIADEAIDIAIEENFEHEFELSIKYELDSESMYAIYGCMTQNGDTVPIYVQYYDENDYQYVDIKLNDDGSIIGLKEQVEPFKKDHEYLFEIEPKGTGSFFTGGGEGGGKEPSNTNFATDLGKAKAKAQEEIADINSFAAN